MNRFENTGLITAKTFTLHESFTPDSAVTIVRIKDIDDLRAYMDENGLPNERHAILFHDSDGLVVSQDWRYFKEISRIVYGPEKDWINLDMVEDGVSHVKQLFMILSKKENI